MRFTEVMEGVHGAWFPPPYFGEGDGGAGWRWRIGNEKQGMKNAE
jgi:hypothetical protein